MPTDHPVRDAAQALVRSAVAKGELDKLLLGESQYWFKSKHSYSPGPTDVSELIDVIYICTSDIEAPSVRAEMARALSLVVERLDGVDGVAHAIYTESFRRNRCMRTLGIPIQELATRIRRTIAENVDRLREAPSWAHEANRFEDLRHLSRITTEVSGPAFCD